MDTNELRKTNFDARDAALLLGGFTAVVALASAIKITMGSTVGNGLLKVASVATLGLPFARRAIFGAVPVRPIRTGILWSLLSIATLFLMLGAFVATCVAGLALANLNDAPNVADLGAEYIALRQHKILARVGWSLLSALVLATLGTLGLELRFVRPER
jgi:hypothetical protein